MAVLKIAGIEASLSLKAAASWQALLESWNESGGSRRLWAGDASLWTGDGEEHWLGWLEPGRGCDLGGALEVAVEVRAAGLEEIVVLGMGGSVLGALVLAESSALSTLRVLDSTSPVQIARVRAEIDPRQTLFVVGSKSGSTLETAVLADYFLAEASRSLGRSARDQFVAITDPGSDLEGLAREGSFRAVFLGARDIGGRFSVLSAFGLVPLALAGGDPRAVVHGACAMAQRCGPEVPAEESPAVALGLLMVAMARQGYWLSFESPLNRPSLGDWVEQLVAESTGKDERGILPFLAAWPRQDGEGSSWRMAWRRSGGEGVGSSEAEGVAHPDDGRRPLDIGAELFRWELATAVSASVMGVNPFIQPDVEASKAATRCFVDECAFSTADNRFLPSNAQILDDEEWTFLAANEDLAGSAEQILAKFLGGTNRGDFVALQAWMDRAPENIEPCQRLLRVIGDRIDAPTSLGFGPRYLHSTGQYFKGGPNHGRYLQITTEPTDRLPIPNRDYDFATLSSAQARGDFEVLAERGRRVLQIHLKGDLREGLERLEKLVERALDDLT